MTSLCNCHRCDYELRRIASDAGDVKARARMTEPERRRAAGETPFRDSPVIVSLARTILSDVLAGSWELPEPHEWPGTCGQVAALLRALVLQGLCDLFEVSSWA
jgi:hypothetical protein